MFRKFEFLIYAVLIIGTIVFNLNPEGPSGRRHQIMPRKPALLVPEAYNPAQQERTLNEITVDVEPRQGNSVGTGFVISDKGLIITARHVVDGCKRVLVREDEDTYHRAEEVISYSGVDFATLKVPGLKAAPLDLDLGIPEKGETGFMMGYPQGRPADLMARVIGYSTMRTKGRYQARERITAWVEVERTPNFSGTIGGISGGPVFDTSGKVFGTAIASSARRGRVYTTDPSVFDRSGVLLENDRSGRRLSPRINHNSYSDTGAKLRDGLNIVQIVCLTK